jgi:hypothetical protein
LRDQLDHWWRHERRARIDAVRDRVTHA